MFTQADSEGIQFLLLDEDGFTIGHNGNRHKKKTTKGHELNALWKDSSTNSIPLKDMYVCIQPSRDG